MFRTAHRWIGLFFVVLLGLGAAVGVAAESPLHVVFIIAEREYDTRETLPVFAERHLPSDTFRTTFVEPAEDDPNNFPELIDAVADADLIVLSVRRRALPEPQLQAVRDYLEAGGPLVAIRTSSHAFDPHGDLPEGAAAWRTFDVDVLGGHYEGHYANHGDDGPPTVVVPADKADDHPILAGWDVDALQSTSHLYRNRDVAADVTPLLTGHLEGDADETTEPVAWTHSYHGGRVFYTSLGSVDDFALEPFQTMLRNAIHWATDH